MAEPVIPWKRIVLDHGVVELVAWRVPESEDYPDSVKYAFTYVKNGERLIAIDNYSGEGHHIHYRGEKRAYEFDGLEQALQDFRELVHADERDNDQNRG